MEKTYQVRGMTCQGCADTIEAGITASLKVKSATIVLEKSQLLSRVTKRRAKNVLSQTVL